jgi:hypothetical protein
MHIVHPAAAPSESDSDLLAFAAQVEQLEAMLAAHDAAMDAEEEAMQHAQEVMLPELRELNQQLQAQQQTVAENAALIAAQSQPAASKQPLSNSNKSNTQSASSVGREPCSTHAPDRCAQSSGSTSAPLPPFPLLPSSIPYLLMWQPFASPRRPGRVLHRVEGLRE